jgi:hypothetical protein
MGWGEFNAADTRFVWAAHFQKERREVGIREEVG